ncbi:lysylphosphatidylglycerol synthase transmembrane domain-containing protein [Marinobacter arenosus]|uniref:lysylphosphatidylglycerol synthase transmembrane domain-containing protein n=1 Tax=Marinobacter arenosus TaxID=2856822 RepID=UPI001C4C8CEA|nr:lysylphosphatidylglycerol synthase transmembrane domain-containing protein [Marinobacter arenosus]MBW0146470.1 flippase-like domain-containing protein [Marinobacter arenosus]
MKGKGHRVRRPLLKWVVALCLLAAVLVSVDRQTLWQELSQMPIDLLLPALAITVLQVLLSSGRWWYTARRLGVSLTYRVALREYYIASFLNQVLPGGVLGDVNRAWRHGRASGQPLYAMHGVAIERLSGQLVLGLAVLISVSWLAQVGVVPPESPWWMWGLVGLVVVVFLLGRYLIRSSRGARHYLRGLWRDIVRTLVAWPAFPIQMGSSVLVLASYLAVFLILAYGAGHLTSWNAMILTAALCCLLLLSMVLPVTVSGWGVREGAAAVLWPMAGLPPEQGVALSVGYGALVFLSTLPGLVFLTVRLKQAGSGARDPVRKNQDQRAYHCPD